MSGNINIKRKASPLFFKMSVMMALLAILQFLIFFTAMIIGGVFSETRMYAYNSLSEKTQNRSSYIENSLNQCTSYISGYADEVNSIVKGILEDEGKQVSDIRSDKALNKRILSAVAAQVVSLGRSSAVNDAFVYLNTGDLYEFEGVDKLTGFYIRDIDATSNDYSNGDLLLEAGNADVARGLGITMDSEWSLYTDVTEENNFDFFFEPVSAYENNPGISPQGCGYWSGFSRISRSALKSLKYSMPLVLEDGTVYGVIGIGLLEKTLTDSIPTSDFFNDSACYIIGSDPDNLGVYEMQAYKGAAYSRLVSKETLFDEQSVGEYGIHSFNTKIASVGFIEEMNIYGSGSPFNREKWAIISVADSNAILEIYNKLLNTFAVSSLISLAIGISVSIILSRMVTKPVSKMTHQLDQSSDSGEIVSFVDSGITEFDKLASSIVDLQINVREQASRVSDILSISDSGIGTFMYDRKTGTVFVGKSLLGILDFPGLESDEDFTIPFAKFREYLSYFDERYKIFNNEIFSAKHGKAKGLNIETEYNPDGSGQNTKWFRFSLTRDENAVMGLVQDITKDVMERLKIEHERDYDVTTDIYNRRAFYRGVEDMFKMPKTLGISAFLMMDLDNLKFVNDTYGHEYGDRYIRAAADALRTLNRKKGIVARLSGDEFVAFIYGGRSKDDVRATIEEFKETLANSSCTLSDGSQYKLRASGGIAWYPENSESYEQLIKYADFAMYTVKHSTKGHFAEFDKNSYLNDSILVTGIQELNRIIDNGAVKFAFQPIVSVKTGEIFGYEALMCPQSETINTVTELMRLAKSGAKLYEIERLTFFVGLERFSKMIDEKKISPRSRLFLKSISECMLDERSIKGIEEHYRPIFGNVVVENLDIDHHDSELITEKHEIIRKWGGMMALDNFGMGHNNETAMFNSNPDIVIIDRALIDGCSSDSGKATVIGNMIHLAGERGALVMAQGVESDEDLRAVISMGADLVQGFYIAKPEFEPKPLSEEIVSEIAKYSKKNG